MSTKELPILNKYLEDDLLDGAHRLTRALIDGIKQVKAKRLSKEYIEANIEHVKFLGEE